MRSLEFPIAPDSAHIAPRYEEVVLVHLAKNNGTVDDVAPSLILGIHGPSGEGKTFQLDRVLQKWEVPAIRLSGGDFEDPDSGEPAHRIQAAYLAASELGQRSRVGAAIVVNDVDTGLGMWGYNTQYTVNTQIVLGTLMHIVDSPTMVDGQRTVRVPIFVTGNDFTTLYGPLLRPGRMELFEWKPLKAERVEVLRRIFPELSVTQRAKLVTAFRGQPMAFYAELRSRLFDDMVTGLLRQYGLAETIVQLRKPGAYILPQDNFTTIVKIGQELVQSRSIRSHLER